MCGSWSRRSTSARPRRRARWPRRAGLPVEVHVGRTPEIIELADACVAVSGSVSLELMYRAKPTVIVYRIYAAAALAGAAVRQAAVHHTCEPAREGGTVPRVRDACDETDRIAGHVLGWLNDPAKRADVVRQIEALRDRVAVPGACDRAAEFLLSEVGVTEREEGGLKVYTSSSSAIAWSAFSMMNL